MASRMDRYYKNELVSSGRSSKNKSLYDQIRDLDNYSNIEGVATIEKTNEIDISKVQEMVKNRESYKKQKQLKTILNEEKEELRKKEKEEEIPKNYDIKDLLSKVKVSESENKSRSLRKDQIELLKSLNINNQKEKIKEEEEELKELLNTIVSTKTLNGLTSEDVGLFDDLKSDTMVGDASSIKKILTEEKEKKLEDTNMEIDKSFYTSSFGFTQSDFEELKNMNHKIKKGNKFIILLLIVLIILIIVGIAFFMIKK